MIASGRLNIYLLVTAFSALAGCAQLPNVQYLKSAGGDFHPPTIVTAQGQLSREQSARAVAVLNAEANSRALLQKHLTQEEEISGSPLVAGNNVILLQDGPKTYAAMGKAIRSAKDHINMETFTFDDDAVGRHFADLLLEKQLQGVQVNLMYDALGTLTTPDELFAPLKAAGGNVLVYNPVVAFDIRRLNERDHRKLLIVDGITVITGGVNISKVYSKNPLKKSKDSEETPPREGWRDTDVQIEGPAVAMFQQIFVDNWRRGNAEPLPERRYFPPLQNKGTLLVRGIDSRPGSEEYTVYKTFVSAFSHAKRSIHLTQAYFVPDEEILKSLTAAARRGVQVILIVPSLSDSWPALNAGRSHYSELLKAGVEIYERTGAFLHAKTTIIDGVWSAVGSANMDWRSFLHNEEVLAVIVGQDFAKQLETVFSKDIGASRRVNLDEWKKRPLLARVKEWTARLIEYWL